MKRVFLSILLVVFVLSDYSYALAALKYPAPFEDGYFTGTDRSEVLGEVFGVTFSANKEMTFMTPYDANIDRAVLAENKGTKTVKLVFDFSCEAYGLFDDGLMQHPQPRFVILKPGEKNVLRAAYQYRPTEIKAGDASFKLKVQVEDLDARIEPTDGPIVDTVEFTLKNTIIAKDINKSLPANSTITGKVVDKATGKGIKGVLVKISCGPFYQEKVTDSEGKYTFKVYAYKNARGFYIEYAITANMGKNALLGITQGDTLKTSYGQARIIVTPKPGERIYKTLMLPPKAASSTYTVKKVVDIGVHAYCFDTSTDGSTIATIPFHTALTIEERSKYAYLHVFDYKGNLLFEKYIVDETPAIDVSPDGALIATTIEANANDKFNRAIVYDRTGAVYYETGVHKYKTEYGDEVISQIWEVQISDDKRFLMLSDTSGLIWLDDMTTGKTLWSQSTGNGQVRNIKFDQKDSVIYVSSGDGFLRCYSIDAQMKWKTYIDAWATSMEISKNYIVAISKASPSNIQLINKFSGETIRSIPVTSGSGQVAISPDESMIWYCNGVASGVAGHANNLYDIKGNMIANLGDSGQAAAFTPDSKYIAVKNGSYVAVFTRSGQMLWQKNLTPEGTGDAMCSSIWISADAKYIVTGANNKPDFRFWGQMYFVSKK